MYEQTNEIKAENVAVRYNSILVILEKSSFNNFRTVSKSFKYISPVINSIGLRIKKHPKN